MDNNSAIIYKIEFNDYIYIGSTVNFKKRCSDHNHRLNNETDKSHLQLYTTARENGINQLILIQLEECNIDDRFIREQYYIDLNKNNKLLNKLSAKCSRKEYYEKNKEIIKKKTNEHYHNNFDKIRISKKEYDKKNFDKIKSYKREWYLKNKDRISEKSRLKYAAKKQAEMNDLDT